MESPFVSRKVTLRHLFFSFTLSEKSPSKHAVESEGWQTEVHVDLRIRALFSRVGVKETMVIPGEVSVCTDPSTSRRRRLLGV